MSRRRLKRLLALAVSAVLLTSAATEVSAQRRGRRNRQPAPSSLLESITNATCAFDASVSGTWAAGQARAEVQRRSVFTVRFSQVDTQEGTANAVGLGEPAEVTVRLVGSNLHLLDIRTNGALAVTTIFAEESHDGRLKAVHSRSEYAGVAGRGAPAPEVSQYYGDCEVTRS